jgi:hypothetical protein
LSRNAQKPKTKNAIKKKIEQNNRGRGKKTEEKKAALFVMSRDGLFRFFSPVFLNSACYETPKKRPRKKK